MVKVLLTGSGGFIGTHVLDTLLRRSHSVTIVVRSEEKGRQILARHPNLSTSQLDTVVVPDFTKKGAFNKCFYSETQFDAVLLLASPFHYAVKDIQRELLDPSICGTLELLEAIRDHGKSVKRVVLTSSFAAILNSYKPNTWIEHTYNEEDWNPLEMKDAFSTAQTGYRASKLFAEKAAWEFMDKQNHTFSLVTICPTLAFGPVLQPLASLEDLNTSSQRIYNFISGKCKEEMPDTGVSFFLWIDVRDLALAHVRAMEVDEAQNKRYMLAAGYFSNKEICEIINENFPEYRDKLPGMEGDAGGFPKEGVYQYDNRRATEQLGLKYRTLRDSVIDAVKSLREKEQHVRTKG